MEEIPLLVNVNELLVNDVDPEGGVVNFVSLGEAAHGKVSVNGAGTILSSELRWTEI